MEIACFVVLVWVQNKGGVSGVGRGLVWPFSIRCYLSPWLSSPYSVHAVLIDESDIKLTICLTTITVNLKSIIRILVLLVYLIH
jgi:hypothetical protein